MEKKQKSAQPPKLYDLTSLQRDGNRLFGYTAQQVLDYAQALYEKKLLTYPRTDSRYIGTDIVPTIKERLKACNIGPYRQFIPELLKNPLRTNKAFVDDKKSQRPSCNHSDRRIRTARAYDNDERKIYDLVVRRFISVLYPAFEYEQTTLKASAANEMFTAKGKIIKAAGWKAVYSGSCSRF